MKKSGLFFLLFSCSSLLYGQEARMYIPYTLVDDLADASLNRTCEFIDQSLKHSQLQAYFDSGLTKPMSVRQFDSLKIRIYTDTMILYKTIEGTASTLIISHSNADPDSWSRISWQSDQIRIQLSDERYFFLDRSEFTSLYKPENAFFIQQEIYQKERGEIRRDSIPNSFNSVLSNLGNKTLRTVLSGRYPLTAPYEDIPFSPNDIRCRIYSNLLFADCDTLNLDTLDIRILESNITGFAIQWNYQRESGSFIGRPAKIGLSYHPLLTESRIELPNQALFWIKYEDWTTSASEEELEILLTVLFEFQCAQFTNPLPDPY